MRFTPPPPKDSFHEETLFSCFVGKRVRDASIYVSKKYRSSFYSRAIATIATNVTMLQCYMLHVTLRSSHCALPPCAGRVERAGGRPWQEGRRATELALAGGQEDDRSGLGRRARGIVARIGENVFVAVVFAVRSVLLLTFLLFSDVVRKKKRNFAIDI